MYTPAQVVDIVIYFPWEELFSQSKNRRFFEHLLKKDVTFTSFKIFTEFSVDLKH